MDILLLSLGSYLFGNINPAIIITKIKKGVDIRSLNSQNPGATNVTITLGFKYGIFIALLDILKGVIPVLVARLFYPDNDAIWFLAGLMVLIGHIFPALYQFKGGKGTATLIGVLFTAAPLYAAILFTVSVVLLMTTQFIAIPSIVSALVTPVYLYFSPFSNEAIWLMLIFMVISLYKHRINIVNIIQGKETSLKQVTNKKKN
jgi:glycerol-3-phosphate acyltransferase PlsY